MQAKEQLIGIFGKENLLEAIFIFLGGFQNMISHNNHNPEYVDHRNFFNLYEFITKTKEQPLDQYFKLKLSLQGLCLIYEKAYKILNHHNNLNAQEVIDKIYIIAAMDQELKKVVSIVEKENDAPIKLLNMIINPRGEPPFNNSDDFKKKVLKNIRSFIGETESTNHLDGTTNYEALECSDKTEKEKKQYYKTAIPLYEILIELYCQINSVKVDTNIILALIIFVKEAAKYLPDNTSSGVLTALDAIDNNFVCQLIALSKPIHLIRILGEDYTFDSSEIDRVLDSIKIVCAYNSFIPATISKDNLNYLISSDDEDVAKKFEAKILSDVEHYDIEHKSINDKEFNNISDNEERFKDAQNIKHKNFKQTICNLLPNERKIALYTTGTVFITLLFSSILGNFLHNKYNIAVLTILGAAILTLGVFTLYYHKIEQQEPSSELNPTKVNNYENKELSNNEHVTSFC